MFCDLCKAFDCVDHHLLVQKLYDYGVRDSALALIKSYLIGRKQRTVVFKEKVKHISEWTDVDYGVPQGSILGPLLFLIYINDIPCAINKELILFADDTTLLLKNPKLTELFASIPGVMQDLQIWFSSNGLLLNSDKTQIVKFSARNNHSEVPDTFNIVEYHKFLGIYFDKNLNWKVHLDYLNQKLRSITFVFLHLRDNVPFETLKIVYYGYVESLLRYGITLWGLAPGIDVVFRLQKRILRIMTNTHPRDSCRPLFTKLNILTLPGLYVCETLNMIHSNKEGLSQDVLFLHNYSTRNKSKFRYPKHHLNLFEKSPHYFGLRLYNELPAELKGLNNSQFKERLKIFVCAKALYSIKDF